MKINKIISLILVVVFIGSANIVSYASEIDDEIIIANVDSMGAITTNIEDENDIDLIYCNDINENNIDTLVEYIDNGSDVFIDSENIEECADVLNCSYATINDESDIVGCYVKTVGGEYTLTPIIMSVIDDSGDEMEISLDDMKKLKEDVASVNLYQDLKTDYEDLNFVNNISDSELSNLQSSTAIGSSFKDVSVFKYFYKKGSASGTGTTYQYNSNNSVSGYSKLGSIKILGYAIKINKSLGTNTYDNIYSKVTASGLNDKYVNYYTYNMKVTSANTTILDESYLPGNRDERVSVTIANGISSNGNTTTTSTSYSYNPNGQSISNQFGYANVKTWKASNSARKKNSSWIIEPSITVKNSKGTTQNTTVSLYVNEFQVSGGTRTYTIKNSCAVNLTFKNHK